MNFVCGWHFFSAALYIKVDSHNIRDSSSIYNLYVHYNWDMQATEKSKKNMGLRFFLFSRRENAMVNETILTFMECNGIPPGCHGNLQKQTPVN